VISSAIYALLASSKLITACLVHSWGCSPGNLSTKIPVLNSSQCSISRTVQKIAMLDDRDFSLQAAINWMHSSLHTPTARDMVYWCTFTMICIFSPPTAWWLLFFTVVPVIRTIFQCRSWVIWLVAALAASRWPNWCLHYRCVPMSDVYDIAPSNRLDLDPLSVGWSCCVSMIKGSGIGEDDNNEKMWVILRTM